MALDWEQSFRVFFNGFPDPIFKLSPEKNILETNAAFESLTGWSGLDWANRPFRDFGEPTDLPEFDRWLENPVRSGFACRAKSQSGRDLHFELTVISLPDAADFYVFARDVTEVKTLQANIAADSKEVSQFAYIISHDLQEPLRMVASYLSLLSRRSGQKLDANSQEYISFAVDGAKRMKRLIDDLLSYAKQDPGEYHETDGNLILSKALSNLRIGIEESGATIKAAELPRLPADGNQLVLVFQNLIGNALKFRAPAAPEIEIDCTSREKDWLFSVRDNGIGFEMKYATRIFDIFRRLHDRGAYPGTGVGLAICKKIIRRHGGTIWADSNLGAGSRFCFTLPKTIHPSALS